MKIAYPILLPLIQGITEFLPVSSTGHLVLAEHFLPGIKPDLFFDTVLHLGTLLAIIVYFRRLWIKYLTNRQLLINLIICTLPAIVFGFLGEAYIEKTLRSPLVIAGALTAGAIILWLGDRSNTTNWAYKRTNTPPVVFNNLPPKKALLIGLFQSLALIPGASRAGMTIAGGLLVGLKRKEAAEFSFLAAIPVIAGAVTLESYQTLSSSTAINWPQALLGLTLAFVFGSIAIHWLIKYLQTKSFKPFVWYRIILGLLVLAVSII
ncbi:undecaprenyl-diphosphate phosphatase [Patescibacteria group bacterium]|nr:undecaprenyl-diphosphate phosphatase [Patescibacteria group bacterium]